MGIAESKIIEWFKGKIVPNVKLNGSNVERVAFFDGLNIRDTSNNFQVKLIPSVKEASLGVYNTLDQPVIVEFTTDVRGGSSGQTYDTARDSAGNKINVTVPAGESFKPYIFTENDVPLLGALPQAIINAGGDKGLRLNVYCNTTPTAGAVTVVMFGFMS